MKNLLKIGSAVSLALALSGCVNINSTLSFNDGEVTPQVRLHVSEELASIDQGEDFESFGSFSETDEQAFCENFFEASNNGNLESTVTSAGLDSQGYLICDVVSKSIPVNELDDPAFSATYDDGVYVVTTEIENILGSYSEEITEQMDNSTLENLGVKASVGFEFTGKVEEVMLDGKVVNLESPPTGVSFTDKGIQVDLLEVEEGKLEVTGMDEANNMMLSEWGPIALVGIVILAGTFLMFMRSRRRKAASLVDKSAALPELDDDPSGQKLVATPDSEDTDSEDDEDLMAVAARYDSPNVEETVVTVEEPSSENFSTAEVQSDTVEGFLSDDDTLSSSDPEDYVDESAFDLDPEVSVEDNPRFAGNPFRLPRN